MGNLRQLKPDTETAIEDLERVIAKIRSGEISPTTVVLVTRDRVNEQIGMDVCGDMLSYSHLMGVLAYAQAMYYEQANK